MTGILAHMKDGPVTPSVALKTSLSKEGFHVSFLYLQRRERMYQLTARRVRKGYVYSLSTFAATGQGVYEHPPCTVSVEARNGRGAVELTKLCPEYAVLTSPL